MAAVAAIAPPTHLANRGKPGLILSDDPQVAAYIPALGSDPKGPRSDTEDLARKLSPITYVTANYPPTLIVRVMTTRSSPVSKPEPWIKHWPGQGSRTNWRSFLAAATMTRPLGPG